MTNDPAITYTEGEIALFRTIIKKRWCFPITRRKWILTTMRNHAENYILSWAPGEERSPFTKKERKAEMTIIIETTREDTNSDGTYDKEIFGTFWYQNDKLVYKTELVANTPYGYESSKEVSYIYNEFGQEVFREIEYDPILGGVPQVTHVHSTYGPSGFLQGEVWQFMEWANPDNVVIAETHKNYSYLDDGQLTRLREDYLFHGEQSPIDWREETWTYTDFGKVASHVIEDYNFFNVPVTRFYTYNMNESLRNIRLQDEVRFGDDQPRVVESFSYKNDGSLKEHTHWGAYTEFGWAKWVQTQFTHTSESYDKTTKLIDLTGDFKPEFKVVTDTWRNADGQETHILTSYYDSNDALTGRDLFELTWIEDHLVSETRDYNIWDGVVEYVFTSELLVA